MYLKPVKMRNMPVGFEIASIISVGDNFSETEIKICFFHFPQDVYRKILEFGYAAQHREDKDFNLYAS